MNPTRNSQARPLVVLDGLLVNRRPTGVGRSILELAGALSGIDRGLDFLVLATEPAMFGDLEGRPHWRIFECPEARGGTLRKALFTQLRVPEICRRQGAAILHSMQFVAPLRLPCLSVVTVHDLAYLQYPGTVEEPRRSYYRFFVPRTLARAHAIVTNSQATAGDTARYFPAVGPRIQATPFGTPSWVWSPPSTPHRPDPGRRPFFLFVGTLEPRKNLENLLEAYSRFLEAGRLDGRDPETKPALLLVGGKGWKDSALRRQIHDLQARGHLQTLDYCEPDQLWGLYRQAQALLFPSLHEGFGFPILEAMAAQLAVLTSNRGAMAEVGGAQVLAVDPDDPDDIARGMQVLAGDDDLRRKLAEGGPAHARRWNWLQTADATVGVYHRLLAVRQGKK
jgi:glycosyltransferase involved in cell wall biosynthesis